MKDKLSIRSYTSQTRSHSHEYHQLVLPLRGSIHISLSNSGVTHYEGVVSSGVGVIIYAGDQHKFSAQEEASFVVADLALLPTNLHNSQSAVFSLTPSMMAYLAYIESQLQSKIDQNIEQQSLALFLSLLAQQTPENRIEPRIEKVIEWVQQHLAEPITLEQMAKIAFISPTQFKKVFKKNLDMTAQQYVTRLRMEKAKALITHTDTPITIIAQLIGYQDLSAFSRRFAVYFGHSPSFYR